MKNRTGILITASVALLAFLGLYEYRTLVALLDSPPAGSAPAEQPLSTQSISGKTIVVAPDVQRASGIETLTLAASTVRPEITVYATVVDVQPLFDLSFRLAAAKEDVESALTTATSSRVQYERDQTLMKDGRYISEKTLQDARTTKAADQDRLDSAKVVLDGIAASLRLQFGETIANAASTPSSDFIHKLSTERTAMLLVSLPAGDKLSAPEQITVDDSDGKRALARKISVSPRADPTIQGNPFFYLAERTMPIGTHLIGHVPLSNESTPGVLIPDSAMIWYGGQRWAYVRIAPDQFVRRPVLSGEPADGGILVTTDFHPNEQIVVQGAQLLLSQELRPQGIATQCPDPPECDG